MKQVKGRSASRRKLKVVSQEERIHMLKEHLKNLVWFGLVSLFNGISTFVGYLMPKAILVEEQ